MSNEVILVVDDNIANLKFAKNALSEKYTVYTALSAEKMFIFLEKHDADLILLDVEMPEMDGYEAIARLKADKKLARIPVIFLTARTDTESEVTGFKLGAEDFIAKPFVPEVLVKRTDLQIRMGEYKRTLEDQNHILQANNLALLNEISEFHEAFLTTIADLVEQRDSHTGGHIQRVSHYLEVLIRELMARGIYSDEVKGWDIDLIVRSSQLHDVGKIAVPDTILQKPGKLTPEEFEIMKKHTTFGVNIIDEIAKKISKNTFLEYARVFALTHQEKWDGTGYPQGLKGEEIPLLGRLMCIADVYDALVSVRPYKTALSHMEALAIIIDSAGKHFDPVLVDIFVKCADRFT